MKYDNPFTPVFGNVPPVFAGRQRLIEAVIRGLDNAPGDPNRMTIFTGPRGSGKTVLLSKIGAEAESRGWIAVDIVASEGMLEEIISQVELKASAFLPKKAKSRLTGVQISGTGFSREILPEERGTWRTQMSGYLDALAEQDVGLLFTVDEVAANNTEIVQFISTFQLFIRESRNVALLMAGLPGNVLQLFQEGSISFLRRAFRRTLDPISIPEVRTTIKKTAELAKRSFDADALDEVARQTEGMAFLIQLLGYHAFSQSDRKSITLADVKAGIIDAQEDMESMILDASIFDLSDADLRFLLAMLPDSNVSRVGEIAARLSVSTSQASHYKRRLVTKGLIVDAGRGKMQFGMPMLKTLLEKRYLAQ